VEAMLPYVPATATSDGLIDRPRFLEYLVEDIDGVLLAIKYDGEIQLGQGAATLVKVLEKYSVLQAVEAFLGHGKRPFDISRSYHAECERWEVLVKQRMLDVLLVLFVDTVHMFGDHQGSMETIRQAYSPLLNLPALLDVASIYYYSDPESCQRVIEGMLKVGQKRLHASLGRDVADIAENISTVSQVLVDRIYSGKDALSDVGDGVLYLRDCCFSLCCLLGASTDVRMSVACHCLDLLQSLDQIYDHLIPKMYFFLKDVRTSKETKLVQATCELECAAGKAADWFVDGYLQYQEEEEAGGSGAGGSSGISESSIRQGEMLMHALSVLNGREGLDGEAGDGLGRTLAVSHHLTQRIQSALQSSIIFLDDAQKEYIDAILGVSNIDEGSVIGTVDHPASGSSHVQDSGELEMLTKVSQVTEVLPDMYGAGFIAVCLDLVQKNPEHVIDMLLTGSIPDGAQDVDTNLDWRGYVERMKKREKKNESLEKEAFPQLPTKSKPKSDSITSKFLDTIESSYKDRLRSAVISTQWEYDDEYDDSYDEVIKVGGATSGDTVEETDTPKPPRDTNRKPGGKASKLWVLDGKIYNYAKPGAKECSTQDEANKILAEQEMEKLQIHGLGPGGQNKHVPAPDSRPQKKPGAGRGRSHSFKEKNKSAIANHHRKDRATAKQGRGM
jgi:hypothetical protein